MVMLLKIRRNMTYQKPNVEPLASNPINQPATSSLEEARLQETVKMSHVKVSATRWKVIDIDIGT
jgi:hypothetical protein